MQMTLKNRLKQWIFTCRSLNFIRLLRVVITPSVTCESTGRRRMYRNCNSVFM